MQQINTNKTIWSKNRELEKLWRSLATGKKVILIYTDKTYKIYNIKDKKEQVEIFKGKSTT